MNKTKSLGLIADRYHEADYIKKGLSPAFNAAGLEIAFSEDGQKISAASLRETDLLVIFRDGNGFDQPEHWITPQQEQAIADFVGDGGAFLPLHNALALYPKDGPYREVTAGHFLRHPAVREFKVRVTNQEHPVTERVNDYTTQDEQHFIECDEDRVTILLHSDDPEEGSSVAGYAYEFGKGRVCWLAQGHTIEGLLQPEYQIMLSNAIRWCLRQT
ncbi:MAG: ThuA domain-containing protein [Planctomycetota bacterium]|nr:ThuA domain-containing protein [Planctomycetota bacterium]MDP7254596.1 ThuA domain-containing protein [Planctomycetota bacterium]